MRPHYLLNGQDVLTDATLIYAGRAICRHPFLLQYVSMGRYFCNPTVPILVGRAIRVQEEGTNIYYAGNLS